MPATHLNATLIQHVTGVHKVNRRTGILGRRVAGPPTKKEKDFRAEWLRRVRAQHEALERSEEVQDNPDDMIMDQPQKPSTDNVDSASKGVDIPEIVVSEESEEDSLFCS